MRISLSLCIVVAHTGGCRMCVGGGGPRGEWEEESNGMLGWIIRCSASRGENRGMGRRGEEWKSGVTWGDVRCAFVGPDKHGSVLSAWGVAAAEPRWPWRWSPYDGSRRFPASCSEGLWCWRTHMHIVRPSGFSQWKQNMSIKRQAACTQISAMKVPDRVVYFLCWMSFFVCWLSVC